ncbi:hypothetical protein BDW74DRAFT_56039 [Aspergillus multicolor]|uniref:uncharacterized protein n=1 Tax=Aspergillus multicolor TaxID=41759 RepID=UPI003CCCE528
MPPKPKASCDGAGQPPGQFMFVGGPTLNEHAGGSNPGVRSTLLRRVLADKKARRREDAATRLDSMLKNRDQGPGSAPASVSVSETGSGPGSRSGSGSALPICRCGSIVELGQETGAELDSPSSSQTAPAPASAGATYRLLLPRESMQRTQFQSHGALQAQAQRLSNRCPACGGTVVAAPAAVSVGVSNDQAVAVPALFSPRALVAGRKDPLVPVDATASRFKVHELLDYMTTILWPHFRAGDYSENCYKSWVSAWNDSNELVKYTILWSASFHRDIVRVTYGAAQPLLESKEQLELKTLALRALREEVGRMGDGRSPDAMIKCILYLAVNERQMTRIDRDPSPFKPGFTNLHALDFYGSREYHPLHWKVVQDIVARFGGIQSLQMYALAWLLSLSDLMSAVQTLSKPVYPLVDVEGKPLDLPPPNLLFNGLVPDTAGSGFHELFYLWPPVKQEIVAVFIHLGQYSSVLQHYATSEETETCSPAMLDLLGDSRNLIHHRLLCLPDETDPVEAIIECTGKGQSYTAAEADLLREIYLTVRLSAILYAVHVTFPIPRSQRLRQTLLAAIYPRFDLLCRHNVSQPLILWCVAVALSMHGENPPSPLVSYMARLSQDAGADNLDKLVALLSSFAWVDAAVQAAVIGNFKRVVP